MEKNTIRFRKPDNWHAHLREGELQCAVYYHFNIYGRVLCMGNTKSLIETAEEAFGYRLELMQLPILFEPVMTIMLTDKTTPETIFEAAANGIKFVKFIPIGTSTGAVRGLRIDDFLRLYEIFGAMEEAGMHLLVHAEYMTLPEGKEIHPFDREERAISFVNMFHSRFPSMKITVEHASTARMIDFIKSRNIGNVRASLTPQHAILTYSDVYDRDDQMTNPFNHCLPVLKGELDRQAVVKAMISGDDRFFAGTDAAPHWAELKLGDNPPAGIFFGSSEYLRYLEVFEREGAIDKFEDFTSRFGAEYYGYPLNDETITVVQEEWKQTADEYGVNFCLGGETLRWKIIERNGEL